MTVTKVSYFKTFPNGLCWEKVGVEAELIPGDDVRQSLYSCKKTVENFFFESNKAAEKVAAQNDNGKAKVTKTGKEQFIEEINSCKDMTVLKTYEFFLNQSKFSDPDYKTAYDNKFKELQKCLTPVQY